MSVGGTARLRGFATLRPSVPSVTVPAEQATSGPLRLHLTWSTLPTDRRSVLAGLRRSTDVHLGVLWELVDGTQVASKQVGCFPNPSCDAKALDVFGRILLPRISLGHVDR